MQSTLQFPFVVTQSDGSRRHHDPTTSQVMTLQHGRQFPGMSTYPTLPPIPYLPLHYYRYKQMPDSRHPVHNAARKLEYRPTDHVTYNHQRSMFYYHGSAVNYDVIDSPFYPNALPQNTEPKPSESYIGLLAKAILESPEKKMLLGEIYEYMLKTYPYFRSRGSGWRNSVRHNLSLNECFVKVGRSDNGKGHYWSIHPANKRDFERGDFRRRRAQRKVRRHMGLTYSDDDDLDDDIDDDVTEHRDDDDNEILDVVNDDSDKDTSLDDTVDAKMTSTVCETSAIMTDDAKDINIPRVSDENVDQLYDNLCENSESRVLPDRDEIPDIRENDILVESGVDIGNIRDNDTQEENSSEDDNDTRFSHKTLTDSDSKLDTRENDVICNANVYHENSSPSSCSRAKNATETTNYLSPSTKRCKIDNDVTTPVSITTHNKTHQTMYKTSTMSYANSIGHNRDYFPAIAHTNVYRRNLMPDFTQDSGLTSQFLMSRYRTWKIRDKPESGVNRTPTKKRAFDMDSILGGK